LIIISGIILAKNNMLMNWKKITTI